MPRKKSWMEDAEPEPESVEEPVYETQVSAPPAPVAPSSTKFCARTNTPGTVIEHRGVRLTSTANAVIPAEHVDEFMDLFGKVVVRV